MDRDGSDALLFAASAILFVSFLAVVTGLA